MDPGVGVIVPTFNRAKLLRPCLESLLAQTVSPACVLVVDDGSSDDTAAVVASFGGRVRYLHKANGGKARAVNLALEQLQTPWIWLFDDDDIALPRAIEARLAALAAQPGADWVYAPHLVGLDDGFGGIASRREHRIEHPPAERLLLKLMTSCYFHLNSCLVSRALYAAAGPFDPEQKAGEDYDMQIRIAAASARAAFCAEPAFVFRQHQGLRGDQQARYAASERERVFMRFSQRLGAKVRATMPLDAYLVPRRPVAGTADELQAFLGRAAVMGNLGCWREALDDLEQAMHRATAAASSGHELRRGVRALFGNGWMLLAAFEDWDAFEHRASQLRRLPAGPPVLRSLAAGLWDVARGHAAPLRARWMRARHAWQLLRV